MQNDIVTLEELDREIALYLRDKKTVEPLLRLYRALFQVRRSCITRIENDYPLDRELFLQMFREGRCLLGDITLSIDPALFRMTLGETIEAFAGVFPQAGELRRIMELPELSESCLPRFLGDRKLWSSRELEKRARLWGWGDEGPVDSALVAGTIKDALAPFYVSFAEAVWKEVDATLWSEGCCPVCGQQPGMAMLDREGVRILECSLCCTRWQFPRLVCPFCRNRDPLQLGYFYADDYPGRRVQVCERCKSYLKTAVVKEIGREVILGLEEAYTMDLDHLARREGYRMGRDLAVLK